MDDYTKEQIRKELEHLAVETHAATAGVCWLASQVRPLVEKTQVSNRYVPKHTHPNNKDYTWHSWDTNLPPYKGYTINMSATLTKPRYQGDTYHIDLRIRPEKEVPGKGIEYCDSVEYSFRAPTWATAYEEINQVIRVLNDKELPTDADVKEIIEATDRFYKTAKEYATIRDDWRDKHLFSSVKTCRLSELLSRLY